MEYTSVQKYVRTSPKKVRIVVGMIKKMNPEQAAAVLPHLGKRAAEPVLKVVKSAMANARQQGVNTNELVFKNIEVNQGPKLKRWRAGSRGRAKPYSHVMSHIRVVLENKPEKTNVKTEIKKEKISKKVVQETTKKVKSK